MLAKEAFALLTKRVWNMLSANTKFTGDLSNVVNKLKPKAFRENVARAVLQAMSAAIGRTVTPAVQETGENFIETVAFAFAYIAENNRPAKFTHYTPHTFAEILIIKFCTGYAELDASAPTNDAVHTHPVKIVIPATSPAALTLRERLRAMPTAEFGKYSIR